MAVYTPHCRAPTLQQVAAPLSEGSHVHNTGQWRFCTVLASNYSQTASWSQNLMVARNYSVVAIWYLLQSLGYLLWEFVTDFILPHCNLKMSKWCSARVWVAGARMMMMGRFPDLWGGWYYCVGIIGMYHQGLIVICHARPAAVQGSGSHSSGEMNGMETLPS